jgi:hypothetical protein
MLLFHAAKTEFRMENPLKSVPIPRFQKADVEPFIQEEIENMLKSCTYSREAETLMRRKFAMRRNQASYRLRANGTHEDTRGAS